ncbi:hypothetical protein GCQ56_12085 [Marinifilum sp. N1E240]|uniref:carboxypeptidase-like regulatory domain-containing protein n=1 Tax=Marinifilum sp. N1E240 TaxID=2608082 RepID=UPI00128CF0BE|nr:carboxypeptidase-like regulatory domain-containing protein [Marinifilum sp. N1E240]MPQ47744.1 hypothetical protein [Marinifilum sp. N1E240]
MNKKNVPIQNMMYQINDFVDVNKTKLEVIPLVWTTITSLLQLGDQFNAAIRQQAIDIGGYTLTKKESKENLAGSLIKVLNLIYNDCLQKNDLIDMNNYKSTHKKLMRLSYSRLLSKSISTIAYCEAHTESLAEMGISEDMLQILKNDSSVMETYIAIPQEMIKKREEAGLKVEQLAREIDQLQTNQLNKLMESFFSTSDPELYTAYQQAVKREKPGSRKMALIGSVKDINTRQPIKRVHILISEADIDHVVKGEKGGFRIAQLEADTYQVEIVATNYITKQLTLVHNFGETDRLDILLEPEPVA